ncbi:MAG: NUDIX hydrolase [Gammaproteobacteria bacterium]|nr:NUDIX hydrolase [Gammaproteobacteria bacterium]
MNTRAGAWMVIYCPNKKTFLFGKRAPHVNKPNLWNFFGGHLDENERAEEGVIRELYEETGFLPNRGEIIRIGESRMSGLGYVSGIRELNYFLMLTDVEIVPKLNMEHAEYRWFRLNSLPHNVNRPTGIALNIGVVPKAVMLANEWLD